MRTSTSNAPWWPGVDLGVNRRKAKKVMLFQ
jgi:hypothetical protein